MPIIFQGNLGEEGQCAECGVTIAPEDDVFVLFGSNYCSLNCIEGMMRTERESVGADFGANHDQALAAVQEMLAKRPKQFAFIYETPDDEDGDAGITMFCQPDFTFVCVEILAKAMSEGVPTVEPPPE